jgi:hypothetical protein
MLCRSSFFSLLVLSLLCSSFAARPALADNRAADDGEKVSGLIGLARMNGEPTRIAYHYPHGKVWPAELIRSKFHDDDTKPRPSVVITMVGYLEVPRAMAVRIYHAAGGVNEDHGTLFIGDRRIGQVGDDTAKSVVYELKLAEGTHPIRWELTGGTFQTNLLKIQNAETGELLSVYHTPKEVEETGAGAAAVTVDAQGIVDGWPTVDPEKWVRVTVE